jgi:hypothetical protein
MRYAIYSLQTKQLLRTTEVGEELSYDPQTEGYVEIADIYFGSVEWCPKHLAFESLEDIEHNIPSIDFVNRFTIQERCEIHNLSKTNVMVEDLLYVLSMSPTVHLCTDQVDNSINLFISLGILTPQRAFEIRSY